MNEMENYLYNHAYVSNVKTCNRQFELSKERAECIANKYNSLVEQKDKEIERLNNIIEELEKWLIQETIDLYDKDNPLLLDASFTKYATERKMAYMYVLDRLKELKQEN